MATDLLSKIQESLCFATPREEDEDARAFKANDNDNNASGTMAPNAASLEEMMTPPSANALPRKFPEAHITKIDDKDKGTPDDWVPRHPDLIRLTGRHPLNCEPPLTANYEHGFYLPASLHFVRNHGACPRLDWESHKIKIHGLVDRPMEITMNELVQLPSVKIPVTLVCAGNRRREENMIKKTIGFSWGASACSTSVWTGVRLCDLLKFVGVKSRKAGANHVCFVGADPLPKDNYGTSIKIERAMDPAYDVLIAWEQNGKRLLPDHGFPVRLIIPGFIGGRMVKWLTDIQVTEKESTNYYHFFDNRVLPSHVDAEKATAEGWWYKPEYIINDLNINSAMVSNLSRETPPGIPHTMWQDPVLTSSPISFDDLLTLTHSQVYPQHDEILELNQQSDQTYTLKGYAYSGGGRKVIRSEISLDDGKTWRLAQLKHTEKPNAYGKYWCWCHWSLEINVLDLIGIEEISLRSWDEGMNTQPKDITWNVSSLSPSHLGPSVLPRPRARAFVLTPSPPFFGFVMTSGHGNDEQLPLQGQGPPHQAQGEDRASVRAPHRGRERARWVDGSQEGGHGSGAQDPGGSEGGAQDGRRSRFLQGSLRSRHLHSGRDRQAQDGGERLVRPRQQGLRRDLLPGRPPRWGGEHPHHRRTGMAPSPHALSLSLLPLSL